MDDEIAHIPLSSADSDTARVPTAILLKRTNPDDTFTVAKFGIHAQGEATQLNSKQLKDYLYFEFFKFESISQSHVSPLRFAFSNIPRWAEPLWHTTLYQSVFWMRVSRGEFRELLNPLTTNDTI